MKNTETKKTKSIIAWLVMAMAFVCIQSCEEDVKLETPETKSDFTSGTGRIKRVSNVHFDGTEGAPIDFELAKQWVANYRSKSGNPDEIVAHYFGFEIIKEILGQANCVGIRIYYALDETGEKKLILVGVDANGQNLLPSANGRTKDEGGTAADYSYPCPSMCPDDDL